MKPSRRGFFALTIAAGAARILPKVAPKLVQRRVLTIYYDKAAGAMRAIEKIVN